jgi:hypothetical protein
VARSGWSDYRYNELFPDSGDDRVVRVYRPAEELASAATVASGEGKPLAGVGHPAKFLDPNSWSWSAKGHMQNLRIGPPDPTTGDIPLIADLHVQDQSLIDQIEHGVRDLSMGYRYELDDGPEPGTFTQRRIRFNHCALVPAGRQKTTFIVDEDETLMAKTRDTEHEARIARMDRLCDALEKLISRRMKNSAPEEEVEDFSIAEPGDNREKPDTFEAELIPVATLPSSERGQNPVVDHLRALKPFIQASGDRRAIDAFNNAMRSAKKGNVGPAELLLAAYDRQPQTESFESMVARRRAELLGGKSASEPPDTGRRAQDRQAEPESYQTMVDRRGRELRSGKK